MKVLDLIQGSPEWLALRANIRAHNASEAPAMMGVSLNESRAAFVRRLASGAGKEFSNFQQERVLNRGHANESFARTKVNELLGKVFPIIATSDDGFLSASFDGVTMDEETNWECKSINERLRAVMPEGDEISSIEVGASLPIDYRVQMEHQMLVLGTKTSLFTATDGIEGGDTRHCWYLSDPGLRDQIIPGWQQLDKDVDDMMAKMASGEAFEAKPAKTEQVETLPAVSVRLEGSIRVAGNLSMFSVAVKDFISRIPASPSTDAEFELCDKAVKALKKAEDALDSEEASALASIPDVEQMRRAVEDLRKLVRDTRLAQEKMLKTRKTEVKEQAVFSARQVLTAHIDELNNELHPARLNLPPVDFAAAIKGLRSIDSMNTALATAVANGKIAADAQARTLRANKAKFGELATGYAHLFPDVLALYHKAADDFAAVVDARISKHKADEAAKEAQRKADEEARIQRAAAEAAAKAAEQARAEERAKMRREEEERQRAAAKAGAVIAPEADTRMDAAMAVLSLASGEAPAELFDNKTTADTGGWNQDQAYQAAAIAENTSMVPSAKDQVHAAPEEQATIKLGEICAAIGPGFSMTADFVATVLGVPHRATEKAAKLYSRSDKMAILAALACRVEVMIRDMRD